MRRRGFAGRLVQAGWLLSLVALVAAGCTERIGYERQPTPTPPAPHQTPTPTPTARAQAADVPAIPPEVEAAAAEVAALAARVSDLEAKRERGGDVDMLSLTSYSARPFCS